MAKILSATLDPKHLSRIIWAIVMVLLGLSITPAPWYKFWAFEIAGAGYLWYGATSLLILCSLAYFRPRRLRRHLRRLILTLAIALIFYGTTILNWYIPRIIDSMSGGIPVTAMTYNVNDRYWDAASVARVVRSQQADIFGLIEPFPHQATELHALIDDLYPHFYAATAGELSLYSRYPILEATTEKLQTPFSSLFATLDLQGKALRVAIVHPLAPLSPKHFRGRNQNLSALAEDARAHSSDYSSAAIVMGDFNTTSWSIYFHNFLRRSGLRSASLGHGIHPTWFYISSARPQVLLYQFLQLLKVPIDHILVSPQIRIDRVTTAPAGISDHCPLIAKIRIPQ